MITRRKTRCKKHGLLYTQYSDDPADVCQGCRADALEEKLKEANARLSAIIGEPKVALKLGYPVSRMVEPILHALGFRTVTRYQIPDGCKTVSLGTADSDGWFFVLPEAAAEGIKKVREDIEDLRNNVIQSAFSHVQHKATEIFQRKISDFLDEALFTKELKKSVFKEAGL